jgi:hypothetical protein
MVWASVCGSGAYSLTGSLVVVSCIRCVSGGFEVLAVMSVATRVG